MKLKSFNQLFNIILSDIALIENQSHALLPKMIKKCSSNELKKGVETYFNKIKTRQQEIQKMAQKHGANFEKIEWESPIISIFKSAEKFLDDNTPSPLTDAAIITLLQQIEHLEIALYGTLREYATVTEKNEMRDFLHEILKEKKQTDSLLIKIARESGVTKAAVKA